MIKKTKFDRSSESLKNVSNLHDELNQSKSTGVSVWGRNRKTLERFTDSSSIIEVLVKIA